MYAVCVEDATPARAHREQLISSGILIAALSDVASKAGIEAVLDNFDSTMLRLYRRIGCEVDVLGSTERFGEPVYLGLFPISEGILRKVKDRPRTARSQLADRPSSIA